MRIWELSLIDAWQVTAYEGPCDLDEAILDYYKKPMSLSGFGHSTFFETRDGPPIHVEDMKIMFYKYCNSTKRAERRIEEVHKMRLSSLRRAHMIFGDSRTTRQRLNDETFRDKINRGEGSFKIVIRFNKDDKNYVVKSYMEYPWGWTLVHTYTLMHHFYMHPLDEASGRADPVAAAG